MDIKDELFNLEIRGLEVKTIKKNLLESVAMKEADDLLTQALGPNMVLNRDLADFNHYVFHRMKNVKIYTLALLYNFFAFLLDDHLDRNPAGQPQLNTIETRFGSNL